MRIVNPISQFKIEDLKEILQEIDRLNKFDCLSELEARIIKEIVGLINEGTESAKKKLLKIEKIIREDFNPSHPKKLLLSALKNSIAGALSVAKIYLF